MKDRNVQHASRFRLTKVPGTDDVYDLIPAPGEVYEEGTLINKSALLKDATAALFGLDENAVPDDALSKIKTLINSANANANTKARIATGSYTGTGTYGSGHPNSLTFEFEPKLVFISAGINTSGNCAFVINGQTIFSRTNSSGGGDSADCSFSGNTFTWYSKSSSWGSAAQMNSANVEYLYFAIG